MNKEYFDKINDEIDSEMEKGLRLAEGMANELENKKIHPKTSLFGCAFLLIGIQRTAGFEFKRLLTIMTLLNELIEDANEQ